jgi:hypothetical protein
MDANLELAFVEEAPSLCVKPNEHIATRDWRITLHEAICPATVSDQYADKSGTRIADAGL